MREFPNNNLYCFIIQFDDINNTINELNSASYNIYPNPSTGVYYLDFDKKQSNKSVNIKVHDINKRLVYAIKDLYVEKKQIDFSWLNNGFYYLEVEIEDVIYQKKIIIQK